MSDETSQYLAQVPNQVLTCLILLAAVLFVWRLYAVERDTSDPFSECGCVHLQGNAEFAICPMEEPLEPVSHIGQWILARQARHWVCVTRCKHRANCKSIEEFFEYQAPDGCENWELDDGWYVSPDGSQRALAEKSKTFGKVAHGSRKDQSGFFSSSQATRNPQSRRHKYNKSAAEEDICTN